MIQTYCNMYKYLEITSAIKQGRKARSKCWTKHKGYNKIERMMKILRN